PARAGASNEKPVWDVPAGWEEQSPTSMRLATFLVKSDHGAKADVSVSKLGGAGGGVLLNVKRLRGQLGLQPITEDELPKLTTTQETNGFKITMLDFAGRSVESGEQARMLVAVVPRAGSTWFYKMLGDVQLVSQQKDAFTKFVQSVRYPNAS